MFCVEAYTARSHHKYTNAGRFHPFTGHEGP